MNLFTVANDLQRLSRSMAGMIRLRVPESADNAAELSPPPQVNDIAITYPPGGSQAGFQIATNPRRRARWAVTIEGK